MTESQKIDTILHGVQDLKIEFAKHSVKQEQMRKELDEQMVVIRALEAYRNTQMGKSVILSAIFGFVGAGIISLTKHF